MRLVYSDSQFFAPRTLETVAPLQTQAFIRGRLGVFAPVVILLLGLVNSGFACVCRGAEEPPCVAYQRADAVFIGTVAKFTAVDHGQTRLTELLVRFSVEEPFKGVAVGELEVATATGSDCDLEFKIGEQYLVYAYQVSQPKRLTTGVCTRTKERSIAKEDIDEIHELAKSGHRTWLIGTDGKPSSLLAGAEVIVEGQGKRSVSLVNKRGDFRIELPGAGTYRVTIIAPVGVELINHFAMWRAFLINGRSTVEFARRVSAGQCDFLDLSLMLTAKKSKG